MSNKAWAAVFLYAAIGYSVDATIIAWSYPSFNGASGTSLDVLLMLETQEPGATQTVFSATPEDGFQIATYELLTQGTPFSVTSPGGVLTLDTTLDYETASAYILEIKAVDDQPPGGIGTATISIEIWDMNEPPTFDSMSYEACVADQSTTGDSVATFSATDPDAGDIISYDISSGDSLRHFSFSGNELQVSVGTTLDKGSTDAYTLVIHAIDNDKAMLTGMTTLAVTVGGCNSSSAMALVAGTVVLLLSLVVVLLF